jgi:hypothetical protein
MIFGKLAVMVQNMFGIISKFFNAVDVILAAKDKRLVVIQPVMFSLSFERVAAPKSISVARQPCSSMLSNMRHQLISSDPFHEFGIDPAHCA